MKNRKKIYWYKLEACHGPGHQSKSVFYRHYDKRLSASDRDDEWNHVFRHYDYPIGTAKLLRSVPKDILAKEIAKLKSNIRLAQAELKLLTN